VGKFSTINIKRWVVAAWSYYKNQRVSIVNDAFKWTTMEKVKLDQGGRSLRKVHTNGWNLRNTVDAVFESGSSGKVGIRVDNVNVDKSGLVIGIGKDDLGVD